MSTTFKYYKINAIIAKDGLEGLQKFKKFQDSIDFIITDIQMPNMNGIEMLSVIREIDHEIPTIIMTAHHDSHYMISSIKLSISAYILKPVKVDELHTAMLKAMEPKVLKDRLLEKNRILENEIKKNKEKHQIMLMQSRFASMGELLNMIAHQWRQPLASIGTASFNLKFKLESGKTDLLKTKEDKTEFINFFLNKLNEIESYIQNLTNTIDDFKNFYSTHKIKEKVPVKKIIYDAYGLIQPAYVKDRIDIDFLFEEDFLVNVLPNELTHVILNILKNSKDAFYDKEIENKVVSVNISSYNEMVQLEFKDNAGGISSDIIDKIFDPYFSTKQEKNGTGLGLYLSKIIIEKHHNGNINIKSEMQNTILTIQIPQCF
jgi:signal transduction histidine kinase